MNGQKAGGKQPHLAEMLVSLVSPYKWSKKAGRQQAPLAEMLVSLVFPYKRSKKWESSKLLLLKCWSALLSL